jgi:heat-inducible transcriptional repressor
MHYVGRALTVDQAISPGDLDVLAAPVREAVVTLVDALHLAAAAGSEVFVGGTQRLSSVWHDLSAVRSVLEVLEREAEVMALVAGAQGTSVQLGPDIPEINVDMAIVSTTYESGNGGGTVGVIGPMRMNYKRAISAVEEISRELEEQITHTTE